MHRSIGGMAALLLFLPACSSSEESNVPEDGGAPLHDASFEPPPPGDAAEGGAVDGGVDAPRPMDASMRDCSVGARGEPVDLSCTGLYADWASKTVSPGVVEYDPGLHLFSDGADKTRWILLPPGTKIDTTDMDEWTFPVGTKIWKEFRLPLGDASTATRIETRLLWKLQDGSWYRTTYRWSPDGESSATEEIGGEVDAGGTGYEVPSQTLCNRCHDGRIDGVLGFEAVALSSPAASGLTMQALVAQSLVTAPPASPIVVPGDATESAALGWLHINCGVSCHNANANANASGTGFYMRLDVAALSSVQATNTWTTGWNVPTGQFHIPDASATYRLHSCDPSTSCAYYRASVRNGVNGTPNGTQMPPIVSHKVDQAGLALVAAWLERGCDGGLDAATDAPAD